MVASLEFEEVLQIYRMRTFMHRDLKERGWMGEGEGRGREARPDTTLTHPHSPNLLEAPVIHACRSQLKNPSAIVFSLGVYELLVYKMDLFYFCLV
jgi:hypothetical protein